MRTASVAVMVLLSLAGCAVPVGEVQAAQYQHPESGEVKRCFDNPTNRVILGLVYNVGAFLPGEYERCKTRLEEAGYIRAPLDPEVQAELDRDYAARADSIRKK